MQALSDKVAIVTGAAGGIGVGIVTSLVTEGARVVVTDLTDERLEGARPSFAGFGDRVTYVAADITDEQQTFGIVEAGERAFGKIDVLVNNAAVGGTGKTILDLPVEEWTKLLTVDLTGTFLMCRAVLPGMISRSRGSIINITSIAGVEGLAGSVHYSAAKSGLHGLTKALAREVAQHYINVNAVAPGLVDTEMSRRRGQEESRKMVLWPRIGLPSDIGDAVAYLASDSAEFITGQVVEVGGGTHM
jgi:3-oxoacyl-[acyl-carrier protein] reductase